MICRCGRWSIRTRSPRAEATTVSLYSSEIICACCGGDERFTHWKRDMFDKDALTIARRPSTHGICGKRCHRSLKAARYQMLMRWRKGQAEGSIYWCEKCEAYHHSRQAADGIGNVL